MLLGGDVLRDLSSGAFSARLPFKAVAPSMTPPSPTMLSSNIHCRLMVVEPRPELQQVCDAVLSGPQCTVETEQDLTEARRRLQRDPFDVVLLGLPGTTNRAEDAAAELRLVAAGAPAVIAVRNSSPNHNDRQHQSSFDAVLERPLDPNQLVAAVDELLGQPMKRTVRAKGANHAPWPQPLGRDTAARIYAAVDLGDIESLDRLCDELATDRAAQKEDVEQLQLATRLFDLDALRRIADRCSGT
jgi:DNA-binding response OmpR family regulator